MVLAVILVALAFVFDLVGFGSLFNVTKLLALTAIGFLFVQAFEALSWVVLIAVIIPWVDALSVWRGPTSYVVSEKPSLFDRISIEFRLPGETGSANIGPPDILFFSLFLAAAARFGLRVTWTWLAMVGLLSLTLILTTVFDFSGLPALPGDRLRLPAAERRSALEALAASAVSSYPAKGEAYCSGVAVGTAAPGASPSSSRLTLSMCGVWGNMSTGTHRRSS